MDEEKDVVFSKGINFKELLHGGTEFHIDMNNMESADNSLLSSPEEILEVYDDEGDNSNLEEIFRNLELSAKINKLSTPEYNNFADLAATMTDCLTSGDVKLLILEEGDGPLVPLDAIVTLHYAAYWEKELIPFDATSIPKSFRLGVGKSLPGLEVGITMVKGPTARFCLLLTPKVTWGPMGMLPRIKPETALFVVHLLTVQDIGAVEMFNNLPSEEQGKFATTMKTVTASNAQAKDMFSKHNYKKALKHYHKSISVLQMSKPETPEETEEIKNLLNKVYINLAVCYCKLNQPTKILLMCDELGYITNTAKNAKCMYYYGKAFEILGDNDQAIKFYNKARKLEPRNKDIGNALSLLDGVFKKTLAIEKDMCANIFGANKNKPNLDFNHIDEDLKNSFKFICEELKSSRNYSQVPLPDRLTKVETEYFKTLVEQYDELSFVEDDNEGKKKNYIIKISK